MTADSRTCPRCGAALAPQTPAGLCPPCLLQAGLEILQQPSLRVRCPHCHSPLELLAEAPLTQIECPSCGRPFRLISGETTAAQATGTPQRLAQFELLERVGVGRFGAVWRARDTQLDRVVAIKIPRQQLRDADEAEAFLREARAAAQLRHPSIVSVHEVGRHEDTLFIASDYIHGVTLQVWLGHRPVPPREAAALGLTIADALCHAHAMGVVHRDLKPSNIMMDERCEPHVMDFGLAKREAGEITMTVDGVILGTPAYMSPEQARGEGHQADRRTDVYSLGVILFEMLTGELPFRGEERMLLLQILNEDAPRPRKLNSHIPKDLETICLKCLEKARGRRYASAEHLREDLRRFLDGEPIAARPVGPLARGWRWSRRRPALAAFLGTVLLLLLTLGLGGPWIAIQRARMTQQLIAAHIGTVCTAEAGAVMRLVETLRPARHVAVPKLRKLFDDEAAEAIPRIRVACALAALGEVDTEVVAYLVQRIADAPESESAHLIAALQATPADADAAALVVAQWRRTADPVQLVRYAATALYLREPLPAREMLQLLPDPRARTCFIEFFRSWRGDLSPLASVLDALGDDSARSGVGLALGRSIPLTETEQRQLQPLLTGWYTEAPGAGTHSAASWTLRQWRVELPPVPPASGADADRQWYVGELGLTMLEIPPGALPRTQSRQAIVELPSFWLSDREVSVDQFQRFVDDAEYRAADKPVRWPGREKNTSPTGAHPVQNVNGRDAILFCNWLSRRQGLSSCYELAGGASPPGGGRDENWSCNFAADGYRLPTPDEWEYACRAGTTTEFSFGADMTFAAAYFSSHSVGTEICGSRLPNAWGLFDMHGNVAEWCQDVARPAASGSFQATAGASFFDHALTRTGLHRGLGSSFRNSELWLHRVPTLGFRVARGSRPR